jgi:hypothetical protein
MIDYNNLPIRCKLCFEVSHCFKDCPQRSNHRRPTLPRVEVQSGNGAQANNEAIGGKTQTDGNGRPLSPR